MIAYQRVLDRFRENGLVVQERGHGQANCQAPGHSPADRSVSVRAIEGQVLVNCHSDPTDQVLEALGLSYSDLFDADRVEYDYADGRKVVRTKDKRFFQNGNTSGQALYRVDRISSLSVEAGQANGGIVYVVEGEKDVHALESEGAVAVCSAMGAGKAHMFDWTPLAGRNVTIVADNDTPGVGHARAVAKILLNLDCNVTVVNAKAGKDAADHIVRGYTLAEFIPRTDILAEAKIDSLLETVQKQRESGVIDAEQAAAMLKDAAATVQVVREPEPDLHKFSDLVDQWWEWLEAPDDEHKPIPTPWHEVNDVLAGGLHPGRSYIFAARPGAGKSLTLTNIAPYASKLGHVGAIFSIEMGRMEVTSRVLAAGADAHYGQITRREVDQFNLNKLAEYADDAREIPLYISDKAALTVNHIDAHLDWLTKEHGKVGYCAVDYLQLVKAVDRKMPREQQVSAMSWALKMMSRKYELAMLTACQLNRNAANEGRPPQLSELRESGAIEQDADVVVLLHHEMNNGIATGDVQFILGKNRTGPLQTISLPWRPQNARIGRW